MVLGIYRHLNFSYVFYSKSFSKSQYQRWTWDWSFRDAQETLLVWHLRHRGVLHSHFPPIPHQQIFSIPSLVEGLFLCSCRLLQSKSLLWLHQRGQICSRLKAAGLTPGLDLILHSQVILVPLIATSSNPAVVSVAPKLSRPFPGPFPKLWHVRACGCRHQTRCKKAVVNFSSGGKQL